jgi:hypothetical protein
MNMIRKTTRAATVHCRFERKDTMYCVSFGRTGSIASDATHRGREEDFKVTVNYSS